MNETEQNINLFNVITQYDVNHSSPVLRSIQYLMHNEKSAKIAVQLINKQISNATTRDLGYSILLKVLPDCNLTVIEENSKNWANQALSKHVEEKVSSCRLMLLVQLFEKCKGNQEFNKTIVQSLLQKVINTCILVHAKSPEAFYALNCLYFTMKYFPSATIVYKNIIDSYVQQFLDSSARFSVIQEAAKCYHMLNQIGGRGPDNSLHEQNFQNNFAKLCNTLYVMYDKILAGSNEFPLNTHEIDTENVIKYREIPPYLRNLDIYRILSRRMNNLVTFMIEMLQCSFAAKKCIKAEIIVVVQRGLDIHIHGEEGDSNKVLFNQMIQQHQVRLLFLLKALIRSLRQSLVRHSALKILVQYLTTVSECECYQINSFYKATVYEAIRFWIENCGEQIDENINNKLFAAILKDITPKKMILNLQMNLETKSKKRKSQAITDKVINSKQEVKNSSTERMLEMEKNNCIGALSLLEVLLKSVHLNIKKGLVTHLYNTITQTLLDLCVNVCERPYDSLNCQQLLFKTLIAVFDQHFYTINLNFAVNILALAQRNIQIPEIQAICSSGLKTLEKICQPTHPSLCIETRSLNKQQEEEEQVKRQEAHLDTIKVLSEYLIEPSHDEIETGKTDDQPTTKNVDEVVHSTKEIIDEKADQHDLTLGDSSVSTSIVNLDTDDVEIVDDKNNGTTEDVSIIEDEDQLDLTVIDDESVKKTPVDDNIGIKEPASKKRRISNTSLETIDDSEDIEDGFNLFVDELIE